MHRLSPPVTRALRYGDPHDPPTTNEDGEPGGCHATAVPRTTVGAPTWVGHFPPGVHLGRGWIQTLDERSGRCATWQPPPFLPQTPPSLASRVRPRALMKNVVDPIVPFHGVMGGSPVVSSEGDVACHRLTIPSASTSTRHQIVLL